MDGDGQAEASARADAHLNPLAPSALVRIALMNAPILIALFFIEGLHPFFQTLLIGAHLFLLPGLAWVDRRAGDGFVVLFHIILGSLAASLIAWLVLVPLPGETSRVGFMVLLALITNVGLWMGLTRGWYQGKPFDNRLARVLALVAALFFAQSYLSAMHFTPALEDQDMETQGTAYGLINELSPTMVTNRDTNHFFAHPLLLHFWIGESALVAGRIDDMRHYHESAIASTERGEARAQVFDQSFAHFQRQPELLVTRAPNVWLSAFIVFAMGFLTYRLTGSHLAAAGACLLYMTLPEVFVRTAYGGYMAVTNFLLASGAYFYLQASGLLPNRPDAANPPARPVRLGFISSFMGGWADQKNVLVAMFAPAHAGLRALLDQEVRQNLFKAKFKSLTLQLAKRPDFVAAFMIGLGFVVGWSTFAIYGLIVSPQDFMDDHVSGHIAQRMKLNSLNLATQEEGAFVYPSILGLWNQFGAHSGWLFAIPAAIATSWAAWRVKGAEGMLMLWVVIGAVGFSLVDWRQTKHLAHLLPAMAILIGVFWASLQGGLRIALGAALAIGFAWNVWRIGLQAQDFTYISPTPIW